MNNKQKITVGLAVFGVTAAVFAVLMTVFGQNTNVESISAMVNIPYGASAEHIDTGNFIDDFERDFIKNDRYKYLLTGLKNTIFITIIALVLGIVLGVLTGAIRTIHEINGKYPILNSICKIYTTIIRGTPVLVQLLIIYYVIFASVSLNQILIAGIAFGINSGAYVAEIIRAGLNSVPKGQLEAASSLGLPFSVAMFSVMLPQAIRNILPALCNEGISLLKETSISGYIGIMDITKAGDLIRAQTYDALLPLLVVAGIYLAIVLVLTYLVSKLERRLNSAY